jgi:broad specificity phosphatase PhoE
MRAVFIRHGQSTGNIGVPCHDLSMPELTELGWQQARNVAEAWTERPSLIVTSSYLRTQQTAVPTIERYPGVPVELWPVQEFTYLQPSRWNGSLAAERMPHIERYWKEADPAYCDGEGAESFETLLRRAGSALERLQSLPEQALVYIFSHGQFMQAVRSLVIEEGLTDRQKMQKFWLKDHPAVISNAERVSFRHRHGIPGGFRGFLYEP